MLVMSCAEEGRERADFFAAYPAGFHGFPAITINVKGWQPYVALSFVSCLTDVTFIWIGNSQNG